MKKSQLWLILALCCLLIGGKGSCQNNSDQADMQSAAPSSGSSSKGQFLTSRGVSQADYFAKLGLGGNYGPHYNAFDSYQGYTNYSDAKNSEMETSVPLDFQQMKDAGFQTVRAYGDSAKVWIAMINEANLLGLNVVYTVALCGSDIDDPNHCCLKGLACTGAKFYDLLTFAETQLGQIIDEVGVANFQRAVKLILVGNEALVANAAGHENTNDLINAIIAIKALLTTKGVALGDGNGNGVDISTCTQIGQMSLPAGQLLVQEFTPGAPVVENMYPFQFGDAPTDLSLIQGRVAALQAAYPSHPVMLGETGWPTRGTYTDGGGHTFTGSLAQAQQYYQTLYPYLRSAQIPTLIFEVYDQPSKVTSDNTLSNSEQNYGVFYIHNTMKAPGNNVMFPNPLYVQKPIYDTSVAGVFTFIGLSQSAGGIVTSFSPSAITITLTNPNGFTLTRTYKPFAMKTAVNGEQMVWASVNLYQGSTAAISFTNDFSQNIACTNTVASINLSPRPNPPGADFPAFSGGLWTNVNFACPGCSKVDWGHNVSINAQNIFLHPDWQQ
jgi:exo-beta-1,3-glucanase (GH17 family)